MKRRRPVVAIDGPTAAGKSTVARGVARRLGLLYVDTGAMYRSVAVIALRRAIDLGDADAVTRLADSMVIEFRPVATSGEPGNRVLVDGEDVTEAIRTPEASDAASRVSVIAGVREAMVTRQRVMGTDGGVVMEGRDIGTVVFPDADVKVFLNASLEARARRRHAELLARGQTVDLEEVRRSEAERDRRDETRTHSPLRPAEGAVVLDTTTTTAEEVAEAIVRIVRERIGVV
jgi:cytidylate kinase